METESEYHISCPQKTISHLCGDYGESQTLPPPCSLRTSCLSSSGHMGQARKQQGSQKVSCPCMVCLECVAGSCFWLVASNLIMQSEVHLEFAVYVNCRVNVLKWANYHASNRHKKYSIRSIIFKICVCCLFIVGTSQVLGLAASCNAQRLPLSLGCTIKGCYASTIQGCYVFHN